MAQAMSVAQTTASGRVASVNPKGLKLEGESDWRNLSKFAADLTIPERGQLVTLTLDKAGFVRSVETDGPAPATAQQPAGQKDRTITRLAVLKAAAEFAASRPEAKSGDVLRIAEAWERWVLREDAE